MRSDTLKTRKGQALVETALILMIIVLFTFAITEFGRAMYIKNMLNNAARAGVRQAVVTGSLVFPIPQYVFTNTPPNPSTDPIGAKIYDGLMYVPKNQVTATVVCTAGCTGTPLVAVSGATITVSVTSPFRPSISLFRRMITNTLVGKASMRYE